jgi:DNA-binding XRE family transcriptional regulator
LNEKQQEVARTNLKNFRKEKGWTPKQAAEKMNISHFHYYNLENGNRQITFRMANRIGEVFDVTFEDIFLR